jgi:hypothetical protein
MAKTATLKSATASVRKAKSRRAAEEAAEREDLERNRVWHKLMDAGEKQAARSIVTMDDLIVALGGPNAVSEWLAGVSLSAPERWLKFGYVNRGYHLHVYLALTMKGYRHINPKLFGVQRWGSFLPAHMQLPELPGLLELAREKSAAEAWA